MNQKVPTIQLLSAKALTQIEAHGDWDVTMRMLQGHVIIPDFATAKRHAKSELSRNRNQKFVYGLVMRADDSIEFASIGRRGGYKCLAKVRDKHGNIA